MVTYWQCDKCGHHGEVHLADDEAVYGAIAAISRAHYKACPGCAATYGSAEVRVSLDMDSVSVARVLASMPEGWK